MPEQAANNLWAVDTWFGAGNHLPALAALAPEFPVVDYAQFSAGRTWIFLHKIQQAIWREWYYGNLAGMFVGEADSVNSNDLWPQGNVNSTNWFKYFVDTYVAGHIGNGFDIATPVEAEQAWIDARLDALRQCYADALVWRYIQGKFGLMVVGDKVLPVDTLYHFPVLSEWNRHDVVGHILVYPYFWEATPQLQPSDYYRQANRARVFKWAPDGPNIVETFEFMTAAKVVEAKVQHPPVGTIQQRLSAEAGSLVYLGIANGQSKFPVLAPTARQLIAADTVMSIVVGQNAFFDTVLPASEVKLEGVEDTLYRADGTAYQGAGTLYAATNRRLFAKSARGNVYGEDESSKGITRNLPYAGALDQLKEAYGVLLERYHAITKIPPSLVGVNAAKGESSRAREDLMMGIQSELAADRIACTRIMAEAIRAASGMPMADLTIGWMKLPYENNKEYDERIRTEYQMGIRPLPETRRMLGMPELTPSDLAELERRKMGGNDGLEPDKSKQS